MGDEIPKFLKSEIEDCENRITEDLEEFESFFEPKEKVLLHFYGTYNRKKHGTYAFTNEGLFFRGRKYPVSKNKVKDKIVIYPYNAVYRWGILYSSDHSYHTLSIEYSTDWIRDKPQFTDKGDILIPKKGKGFFIIPYPCKSSDIRFESSSYNEWLDELNKTISEIISANDGRSNIKMGKLEEYIALQHICGFCSHYKGAGGFTPNLLQILMEGSPVKTFDRFNRCRLTDSVVRFDNYCSDWFQEPGTVEDTSPPPLVIQEFDSTGEYEKFLDSEILSFKKKRNLTPRFKFKGYSKDIFTHLHKAMFRS